MRFCGRINSPQNSGHTHYLEQPKAIGKLLQCNARTNISREFNVPYVILQPFAIIERFIGFSFHALPRVYIMDT